jgi:hypothetical protein
MHEMHDTSYDTTIVASLTHFILGMGRLLLCYPPDVLITQLDPSLVEEILSLVPRFKRWSLRSTTRSRTNCCHRALQLSAAAGRGSRLSPPAARIICRRRQPESSATGGHHLQRSATHPQSTCPSLRRLLRASPIVAAYATHAIKTVGMEFLGRILVLQ